MPGMFQRRKGRARALLRAFRRRREGVTAIEFALVSGPLFVMVMGIIEVGLIGMSGASMRDGLRDVNRLTRVGQNQGISRDELIQAICLNSAFLPNCESRMQVEQTVIDDFTPNVDPLFNGGVFQQAGSSQIVVVRAVYPWDIVTPLMDKLLESEAGSGELDIELSFSFQTEAF